VALYLETPGAFLVYAAEHGFVIFPKRACESGELDSIRRLLGTHVVRTPPRSKARLLLLWLILVVVFLVIWQALATFSDPRGGAEPSGSAETREPTP